MHLTQLLLHPPLLFITSITISVLSILPHAAHTLDYPCPFSPPNPASPPPPPEAHPMLPEQFTVQVEANIVNKQMTSEALEVYDYVNKRAVVIMTTNNDTVTSIYDYGVGERLDIGSAGSCKSSDLNSSAFDVFGFTELKTPGAASMLPAAEVFRFGNNQPKVFLGETTVRGIPVNHWQSCQKMTMGNQDKAAYVMDYYFSKPGHSTASGDSGIPIRVLINGTAVNVDNNGKTISGTHKFSHIYDFSSFRPGPVDDETVFEVPRGTVCKRKLTKELPKLPDRFSLAMEVYVPGSWVPPLTERMFFDYDFNLIQTTRYAPRITQGQFGLTELTIVEDYAHHVQYVIDNYDGNCTISAMPHGLSTSAESGGEISMRHGEQMLNYGKQDYKYQGQKWFRDMKVDVWADSSQSGMVQEVYFLAGWPSERMRRRMSTRLGASADFSAMSLLVGTYLVNTSSLEVDPTGPLFKLVSPQALKQWGDSWKPGEGAGASNNNLPHPGELLRSTLNRRPGTGWRLHMHAATEKFVNIFNYMPLHMDMTAFDISMCYKKTGGEMYVYMALDGRYADVVTNQRYSFFSSAKSTLAGAAGISSLRITKVNVWQDLVSNTLNFFFAMLEPPPLDVLPDDHVHPQLPCKDAFANLDVAVKKGLTIVVKHPLYQTRLEVVPDSLKNWDSLDQLWGKVLPGQGAGPGMDPGSTVAVPQSGGTGAAASIRSDSSSNSYSQSQFGGMAFGMLLIGMFVGVVGVYVALRRLRPDIHLLPYQQTK